MTDQQLATATNAIAGLMDATDSQFDDILELLEGNIISAEDCGRIRRMLEDS